MLGTHRPHFTVKIYYRSKSGGAKHCRNVPFNWRPCRSEIKVTAKRLLTQYENIELITVDLVQHTVINSFEPDEIAP